jgi:tetratricopeptide (TPR) repeat protein
VAFGMLFFFLNLALVLQVVSVGQAIMADRYSYLAYVGPLFVIGMLYATAMERGAPRLRIASTICVCLCTVAGMLLTFDRCTVWKNSEVLWTDVLDRYPGSHVAHYNRGMYYRSLEDDGRALADFDRAISLKPNYSLAYNNRGGIRYRRGDLPSALADFDRAIEFDPKLALAHYNRGRVHMARQADDLAIRDYSRAVELQPDLAPAYNNRASIYFNRGDYRRAYDDFDRAVGLDPDNAAFLRNRNHARDALGRND